MYMTHQLREIANAVPPDTSERRRLSSSSAALLIVALSTLLWDGLFNLARLLATHYA